MADNVFINGRAAIHKGSAGKSIAFPDVCLCPPGPPTGPIPTPLTNTAQAADLQGGARTVTIEGNPIAHNESYIAKSTGNEVARSTGGGIITGQVQGRAYFQTYSRNVFIEGKPAVRHLDLVTHNQRSKIPGNTPPTPWMSAMTAGPGPVPQEEEKQVGKKKDWIKIKVIDQDDHPVSGVAYRVTSPDGKSIQGRLFKGGVVAMRGIAKGTCEVELEATPAAPAQATGKNKEAQPYKDKPLKLATGKEHLVQITIPRVLCVHLAIDPTNELYAKHKFVLRSKDGSYESPKTIADDAIPTDRELTLEFPDLDPGKVYTLLHDHGDGTLGTFFADQSYDDLFPTPAKRRVPLPKEVLVQAPASSVPDMHVESPFLENERWLGIDLVGLDDDEVKDGEDASPGSDSSEKA